MVPDYGITKENISMIDSLQRKTKVVLDIFGNPYSLYLFNHPEKLEAIIISYQENKLVENLSAQMIMGGIAFNGKLPVTASSSYPYNSGIESNEILRLKYTLPEEIGIDSKYLKKVDSIALYGIEKACLSRMSGFTCKRWKSILSQVIRLSHLYDEDSRV
jgi:beta-N-acetylhexosaminidase